VSATTAASASAATGGATWDFVTALPIGQFYHVAVDMDVPYHVYGGLQDNGAWRGRWRSGSRDPIRNLHWDRVGGGDGFDTRPIPRTRGAAGRSRKAATSCAGTCGPAKRSPSSRPS